MKVSSICMMLDPYAVVLCIMIPYGYASARGVHRGRRAAELLAGCRAARGDPAGGQPADPLAREAARAAAPRSLRSSRGAPRGGPPALPECTAAARRRGAAARRARGRGGGRAPRPPRDRRLDG